MLFVSVPLRGAKPSGSPGAAKGSRKSRRALPLPALSRGGGGGGAERTLRGGGGAMFPRPRSWGGRGRRGSEAKSRGGGRGNAVDAIDGLSGRACCAEDLSTPEVSTLANALPGPSPGAARRPLPAKERGEVRDHR